MKRIVARALSVLLVFYLSLAVSPVALMEETIKTQEEAFAEATDDVQTTEEIEGISIEPMEQEVQETTVELAFNDELLSEDNQDEQDTPIQSDDAYMSPEQETPEGEVLVEDQTDPQNSGGEATVQTSENSATTDVADTDQAASEERGHAAENEDVIEDEDSEKESQNEEEDTTEQSNDDVFPTESMFDMDVVFESSDIPEEFYATEAYAASSSKIAINDKNFPDPVFKQYISDKIDGSYYGNPNKDGYLSSEEISNTSSIDVTAKGVKDLTGIKFFTELEELVCHQNEINSLDVSGLNKLRILYGCRCNMTYLNVKGCKALEKLQCFENQIISLDLSGCTSLTEVSVIDNQLNSLNVDKCSALKSLRCYNNAITTLDVHTCGKLEYLLCYDNQLTSLNVKGCSKLKDITCYGNMLTSLDVSNHAELDFLSCGGTQLRELNIQNCPKLEEVYCNMALLTKLDLSGCPVLKVLECRNNQLAELNVNGCAMLEKLDCCDNKLSTLNIADCADLVKIVDSAHYTHYEYSNHVFYNQDYKKYLWCDCDVVIIGGNPLPPVARYDPDADVPAVDTSAAVSLQQPLTISAVKKNNRATVTAAPYTVYQLDLGGKTGKKYKSSKKKVAVVDGNGNVTIRGAGKTKITFKVGKKKRTVTLTVKDPTIPASVALNPVNTAVKVGESVALTPVIPDGTASGFKWKSSNKKVARVSNGVVTFKKPGKATITCTCVRGKKKAKVTFRVSK